MGYNEIKNILIKDILNKQCNVETCQKINKGHSLQIYKYILKGDDINVNEVVKE